jgi:hypothetical protein
MDIATAETVDLNVWISTQAQIKSSPHHVLLATPIGCESLPVVIFLLPLEQLVENPFSISICGSFSHGN